MANCMFDDNHVKQCDFPDKHEFIIGGRSQCRTCETYQKWRKDHEKELIQLRNVSRAM